MVSVFVDTSALYGLIDVASAEHLAAAEEWVRLRGDATTLRTHNYVVVEATVLLQRRFGMDAVADLHRNVLPLFSVRFVDRDLHTQAAISLVASRQRKVSLVDWTSFEMMRGEHLTEAFAFDEDFADQGFSLRPAG